MDAIEPLAERARHSEDRYHEFLRVPAMSVGVYVLAVGAVDGQVPHNEDEIYYVARGRGRFTHGPSDRPVVAGDILFVPAHAIHRFHTIAEELVLLVVFAPAERGPS
jgi:mannose-6-phosphate isomerase-like protein (cupin superfamily)